MWIARIFKSFFGVMILALAVWAFAPVPRSNQTGRDDDKPTMAVAMEVGEPDAIHTLNVFPGAYYMPGTIPAGMGEPLTGFVEVARDFVERVPDTRIVFRNVPASDREWIVTQLMAGQAPDIAMVNVEDTWADLDKRDPKTGAPWWLPLDRFLEEPNEFVPPGEPGSEQWWDMFKYQTISRGKGGPDGKMYCVSLDVVETGIFYNKTKFDELGLSPPETWAEFMHIHQVIRDAGYQPFLTIADSMSDWAIDLLIDQMYADILPGIDLLQDPLREQYLQGYLDWDEVAFLHRKGFFSGHDPRYREVYRILRDWREYWNQDLGLRTMDPLRGFIRQEGLMIWDASWTVQRLVLDDQIDFEWDIFYLPPITEATSKYGPGLDHRMCVIGGVCNQYSVTMSAIKDTWDMDTSQRLRRVIQFLQFMCLPENAERIVNQSYQFMANIKGVPVLEPMKPFEEILKRRYTTTKFRFVFDLQFVDLISRMLGLYLNDGCDLDELMATLDPFFGAAAERAIHNRGIDLDRLQRRWEELAPLRASYEDLPHGAW